MRLADRLGGHLVQGHVDAVGEIVDPAPDLRVRVAPELLRYVVEKGSVTVDGVSLTVVAVLADGFTVAVIPHTVAVTTLGSKTRDDGQCRDRRRRQVRRIAAGRTPVMTTNPIIDDVGEDDSPTLSGIEEAARRVRAGRDPRRGGRRGSRERGRSDHGRRARDAREDRVLPASHVGLHLCADHERARAELELRPMVEHNTESMRTAFLVSIDARHGTTTGISAFDRAATVQALVDPATRPGDLARPGHIFPLAARAGGVLKRAGHTEATVDLARMAGLYPAGILCEIVDDKKMGMARQPELLRFARKHGLLHDLHRRPDPVSPPEREAGPPGGRGPDPDRLG